MTSTTYDIENRRASSSVNLTVIDAQDVSDQKTKMSSLDLHFPRGRVVATLDSGAERTSEWSGNASHQTRFEETKYSLLDMPLDIGNDSICPLAEPAEGLTELSVSLTANLLQKFEKSQKNMRAFRSLRRPLRYEKICDFIHDVYGRAMDMECDMLCIKHDCVPPFPLSSYLSVYDVRRMQDGKISSTEDLPARYKKLYTNFPFGYEDFLRFAPSMYSKEKMKKKMTCEERCDFSRVGKKAHRRTEKMKHERMASERKHPDIADERKVALAGEVQKTYNALACRMRKKKGIVPEFDPSLASHRVRERMRKSAHIDNVHNTRKGVFKKISRKTKHGPFDFGQEKVLDLEADQDFMEKVEEATHEMERLSNLMKMSSSDDGDEVRAEGFMESMTYGRELLNVFKNIVCEKISLKLVCDTSAFIYMLMVSKSRSVAIVSLYTYASSCGLDPDFILDYVKAYGAELTEIIRAFPEIAKMYSSEIRAEADVEMPLTDFFTTARFWVAHLYSSRVFTMIRNFVLGCVAMQWMSPAAAKTAVRYLGKPHGGCVLDIMSHILNSIGGLLRIADDIMAGKPITEAMLTDDPVNTAEHAARSLLVYKDKIYEGLPMEGYMDKFEFIKKAEESIRSLSEARKMMHNLDARKVHMNTLILAVTEARLNVLGSAKKNARLPPLGIVLHGDPGIGKSLIYWEILKIWSGVMGREFSESHVYTKDSDQWWEKYQPGSQPYIHFSELGGESKEQVTKHGDPIVSSLTRLLDSLAFPCPMAFSDKGNVYATPEVVIIDTNNPDMHLGTLLDNPAAARRRFLYIELSTLKQYRLPDSTAIDVEKSMQADGEMLDRYKFRVYTEQPSAHAPKRLSEQKAVFTTESLDTFRNELKDFFVYFRMKIMDSKYGTEVWKHVREEGYDAPESKHFSKLSPATAASTRLAIAKRRLKFARQIVCATTKDHIFDAQVTDKNVSIFHTGHCSHKELCTCESPLEGVSSESFLKLYTMEMVPLIELAYYGGDKVERKIGPLTQVQDSTTTLMYLENVGGLYDEGELPLMLLPEINTGIPDEKDDSTFSSETAEEVGARIFGTLKDRVSPVDTDEKDPDVALAEIVTQAEADKKAKEAVVEISVVDTDEKDPDVALAEIETQAEADKKAKEAEVEVSDVEVDEVNAEGLVYDRRATFKRSKEYLKEKMGQLHAWIKPKVDVLQDYACYYAKLFLLQVWYSVILGLVEKPPSIGMFEVFIMLFMTKSIVVLWLAYHAFWRVLHYVGLRRAIFFVFFSGKHKQRYLDYYVSNLRHRLEYMNGKAEPYYRSPVLVSALAAIGTTTTLLMLSKKMLRSEGDTMSAPRKEVEEKEWGADDDYSKLANKLLPDTWNKMQVGKRSLHTSGGDQLNESIRRNVRMVEVRSGGHIAKTHILGLRKGCAIINKHNFFGEEITISISKDRSATFSQVQTVFLKRSNLVELYSDFYVFDAGISFVDIMKHFAPDDIYGRLHMKGYFKDNKVDAKLVRGERTVNSVGGTYHIGNHFEYRAPHGLGDCGYPLIVQRDAGWVIGGIHSAGSADSNFCVAIQVSQAGLCDALEELGRKSPLTLIANSSVDIKDMKDPVPKSSVYYVPFERPNYYGRMPGPIKIHSKSRLTSTPYASSVDKLLDNYGMKPDETFGPPLMEPTVVNGEYLNSWNIGLEKMAAFPPALDRDVLGTCIQVYLEHIKKTIGNVAIAPYTYKTAVNGIFGNPSSRRIDVSTAGGTKFPGTKAKHLPLIPGTEERKMSPELSVAVTERMSKYVEGFHYMLMCKACFKDEALPSEKVRTGKTRIFYSSDCDDLVIGRILLGPLYALMLHFRKAFGSCVGINMFKEASTIAVELEGMCIMEGDYSKYDQTMPLDIGRAVNTLLVKLAGDLGYNEAACTALNGYLTDELFPFVHFANDLFEIPGLQPSGKYGTAENNSIRGVLMVLYAWYSIAETKEHDFFECCKIFVYGDDVLIGIDGRFKDHFNNFVYRDFCAKHYGMKFTPASKGAVMKKFVAHSDMSFLKRTFVYRGDIGMWTAPISSNSISKSMKWFLPSKFEPSYTQLASALCSTMWEVFFHFDTEEEFDSFKADLCEMLPEDVHKEFLRMCPTWKHILTTITSD